jgi:hypothetical protein
MFLKNVNEKEKCCGREMAAVFKKFPVTFKKMAYPVAIVRSFSA